MWFGKFFNLKFKTFNVDFVWCCGETYKNVTIEFDEESPTNIIFNGECEYFDAYYIHDLGWSSDNKYYKFATPDFVFWISPNDLTFFRLHLNRAHRRYKKYSSEKNSIDKRLLCQKRKPLNLILLHLIVFFVLQLDLMVN